MYYNLNTLYVDIKLVTLLQLLKGINHLNTLYVDIKQKLKKLWVFYNVYLNTLYVDIKPDYSFYRIGSFDTFKYIICWY